MLSPLGSRMVPRAQQVQVNLRRLFRREGHSTDTAGLPSPSQPKIERCPSSTPTCIATPWCPTAPSRRKSWRPARLPTASSFGRSPTTTRSAASTAQPRPPAHMASSTSPAPRSPSHLPARPCTSSAWASIRMTPRCCAACWQPAAGARRGPAKWPRAWPRWASRDAYEGALQYVGNPELISRTHFARFLVETGVCRDTGGSVPPLPGGGQARLRCRTAGPR